MPIIRKSFNNEANLSEHLKSGTPSFYFSSQTSTVIPYDKLEEILKDDYKESNFALCDLSKLPSIYSLNEENNLVIRGPLTWQDARNFLKSKGRNIMTSPTEDLALITAGAATSCTGERCFGYGNLRNQIVRIKYLDFKGQEKELSCLNEIADFPGLTEYKEEFKKYHEFKNGPFPRLEKETDLMIGTEGQLGVITEIEIKTVELFPVTYFFMQLPRWETNYGPHLDLFHKVQSFRSDILSCELVDANAFAYLDREDQLGVEQDIIFLEVKTSGFEKIFEELLTKLEGIDEESIFEISEENFHNIRAKVPRAIFESNSKSGVLKMGTDVQVLGKDFQKLMDHYRAASQVGVEYNLFGHFGDAHLHFNFMPKPDEIDQCISYFKTLYADVCKWEGSPFAEHGIGIIKQKYITPFYNENHKVVFEFLKNKMDPNGQFFPQGFMSK